MAGGRARFLGVRGFSQPASTRRPKLTLPRGNCCKCTLARPDYCRRNAVFHRRACVRQIATLTIQLVGNIAAGSADPAAVLPPAQLPMRHRDISVVEAVPSTSNARQTPRCTRPLPKASPRGRTSWLNLLTQHVQIPERKYCRPHARPFRLRFARIVAVLPVCSPATVQALRRPRPSTLAAVNLAPAVRHGCRSAGLACPLGSSTAAGSSVRHNQGLKARPHALNRFALARKRFIAHF
jgi:hypothetical protein